MESAVFIRKQMRNPGSEVETVLKNQTETLDLERVSTPLEAWV